MEGAVRVQQEVSVLLSVQQEVSVLLSVLDVSAVSLRVLQVSSRDCGPVLGTDIDRMESAMEIMSTSLSVREGSI